jgi:adenylyltransferase/sulfurtransferase
MSAVKDTTFLVVGAGGLGCPALCALAAAGAGRIVIVDDDVVDLSNLQRQILYRTADVGQQKAPAAKAALARRGVSPLRIEAVTARFDRDSARALCHDADVVLDGSDNLATKFLVNDLCTRLGLPFVIAGVLRAHGQVFPIRPGRDACYRCLFEAPPALELDTCADAGVFGATCGEVGALQARAALALATSHDPDHILGRVWLLAEGQVRWIQVNPRSDCSSCGEKPVRPPFEEVAP